MRLFLVSLASVVSLVCLMTACSTSPAPTADAGSVDSSADASLGPDVAGDAPADSGDAASDAVSCACPSTGACDSLGCPPDYSSPAFAGWCATVQAAAAGHIVTMRTCGSLLMMTYGINGCERGYAVDQPSGALVATLDSCNGAALTCASLQPAACVRACCLDKSCTLGVESLCPPWQPDAGDDADAPGD